MALNALAHLAASVILVMATQSHVVYGFQNAVSTSKIQNSNHLHHQIFQVSPNDDESNQIDVELDTDATPLFEEPPRTLFGLEPKAELDPLDNGLTFTGPIILLASIYFTISLLFVDDVPPLDSF